MYERQTAREIYLTAETYYKLSDYCNLESFRVDAPYDTLFNMPIAIAAVTCHALCCELYLKSIYYIENNKMYYTHDIEKLFNKLSPYAKEKITMLFNSRVKVDGNDILDYIKSYPEPYIKTRYWFEPRPKEELGKGRHYLLPEVVLSIRKYIFEIKPEWPILVIDSE